LFSKPKYVKAVDGVNLSLGEGETLAVVGESGSGKTTLGKSCLRLVEPYSGRVLYRGRDITRLSMGELKWYRREAQIIHQDPFSSLNPFFTVWRNVEEPLIVHGVGSPEDRARLVDAALEDVKLMPVTDFAGKYPHMLSGGQRQRVAIARAVVLNPKFVVADEPVSMLDASVRVEILNLLTQIQNKHNVSFMYITHDIATARYFSQRVAIMYSGKIVEVGGVQEVIRGPLHPYTQALIEAVPDPDPQNRFRERKVPAGEAPDPTNVPTGCRYHPRCPFTMDECRAQEPPLLEANPGRSVACFLSNKA
jgi:peptide/nickel transport system ATP-binding protein